MLCPFHYFGLTDLEIIADVGKSSEEKVENFRYLTSDERVLNVTVTEAGEQLKEQAVDIPRKMGGCIGLSGEDARELYRILHKVLALMEQE